MPGEFDTTTTIQIGAMWIVGETVTGMTDEIAAITATGEIAVIGGIIVIGEAIAIGRIAEDFAV